MDLKEIIAISGKSGLYKIVTQTKNGLIAESFLDQKRIPVYASDKISNLEEISIYTDDKEVPLKDVLKTIFEKENGGKTIDPKSDEKKLKEYFAQVLPSYDRLRVYTSDIKKIYGWYNILQENNVLDFTEKPAEEPKEAIEGDVKEGDEKPEKKDEKENIPPVGDEEKQ